MAFAAIAAAVIGAYSANRSASNQRRATRGQRQATDQQMELAQRQAALAEQQYADWRENFFPLGLEMIDEARKDVRPDYARIAADNAGAFNAQRGGMTRAAQRMGINPQSGVWGTSMQRLGSEEAKTHVLARNRAREDGKGQRFRNMAAVYGMGSGMPGVAGSVLGSAAGSAGNAAAGYGALAAAAGRAGAEEAAGWGQVVGSIPWGSIWSSMGGGTAGAAASPVNSVGPTAGGYSYPGGQPGPWAGGMNYTSSREAKENIEPVNPDEALDDVMGTPVRRYNYKGNPQQITGTIAEEAPGSISDGRQVSAVSQIGTLTGAVQALAKQVNSGSGGMGSGMKRAPAGQPAKPRRGFGTRMMDRIVPDRNSDGRRSGREWAIAGAEGVANYATGGLYGIGRNLVNRWRNRDGGLIPGHEGPVPQFRDQAWHNRQAARHMNRQAMGSTQDAVRRANAANNRGLNANQSGQLWVGMMDRMAEEGRDVVADWQRRNVQ